MTALGYIAASVPPRMATAGSAVAIPILAVEQLNDVSMGGALVAVSLGPSLIAAPVVGAALDTARRPGVFVALAGLSTAAAFGATAFLGQIPLPYVFAGLALSGAVSPFYMGGLSSFVADIIPDARRAFAFDALSYNFSAVAGPALVAVMAALLSAAAALGVLAAVTVLGAASVMLIRLKPHTSSRVSSWGTISAGMLRIFRHPPLAVVTASSTLSQLGQGGLGIAAIALSVDRIGLPSQGAIVVTAFALGSLLGGLIETVRPTRALPHSAMMVGFIGTGVMTVVAAFNFGIVWTVIAIGLSGIFTASSTAAMLYLRSQLSPPQLKSQIFTVGAGLRTTASALGAVLAASAAGLSGTVTVAAIGLVWVLSGATMVIYPKQRLQTEAPSSSSGG